MTNQRHPIDEMVSSSMKELMVSAPGDAWANIQKRLPKKKKTYLFYLPWAAVVVLAASIAVFYPSEISQLAEEETLNNSKVEISEQTIVSQEPSIPFKDESKITSNSIEEQLKNNSSDGQIAENTPIRNVRSNIDPLTSSSHVSTDDTKIAQSIRKDVLLEKLGTLALIFETEFDQNRILSFEERQGYLAAFVESQENRERDYQLSLQGQIAPQYSYRNSTGFLDNTMYIETGGQENHVNESAILAFAGGFDMSLENKRWQFTSGVHYSRQGQQINNVTVSKIVFQNYQSTSIAATSLGNVLLNQNRSPLSVEDVNGIVNQDPTAFNSVNSESIDGTLTNLFDFIEVPFLASYKIIDKDVELSIRSGMSLGILFDNQVKLNYQGVETNLGGLANLNTMNYHSLIGLNVSYPLSKGLRIYLQPTYKQSLSALNRDYIIRYYYYSLSVTSGVSIEF